MSHHRNNQRSATWSYSGSNPWPGYYPPASSARPAFNAPQSFPSNAPQSFPSNAPQAFSPWPPSDASMMNRPNVYGGRGGHGGPSPLKGGRGGLGEATLVATEDVHRYREIHGGFGGNGGWGGVQGGGGGVGQATTISKQLVSDAKAYNVPNMTVADFCHQYNVSKKIRKLLEDEGFETAGALFEVADTTLKNAGFKSGQIEELKRALKEYYHAATTGGRSRRT
ncbi:hypothetical protein MSAN_00537700 [Mycena sanguinolenta]|uniref:Uncharacterized protein n=1 Tax=Mycena sanguinolenta TaxID=230812 RepID=A0A8H7DHE9_9AGAR|nr:hypothetical protein MSAN_00537700 [Mycena sanguinolenta]